MERETTKMLLKNKDVEYLIAVATEKVAYKESSVTIRMNRVFGQSVKLPEYPAWAYKQDKEWRRELCRTLCLELNRLCSWHKKSRLYVYFIAPTKLYRNYLSRVLSTIK